MMEEGRIVVDIETQTFRFTPSSPINHHDAVSLAGGTVSGPYVVVSHEQPRATFVIEPDGSVLVHGIARAEVARIAIQELLLTLGMSEENLTMELGGMLIRFTLGRAVMMELAAERFADIELDDRLGALRINAALHNAQILLFNNEVYGLTKGQYSPTSKVGMKTKSTPGGSIDHPVDPIAFALGCGATFVARTIDTDANHLQSILRRAHEHKGTAFVEILQNCPVFNDGAFSELEGRNTRADSSLLLEQGEPLVFGSPGNRKGVTLHHGNPALVDLTDDDDPVAKGVGIHDESRETTAYASVLATLHRPNFPVPVGVFREAEKSCYEQVLQQEVDEAIARSSKNKLASLMQSGETWTVEP